MVCQIVTGLYLPSNVFWGCCYIVDSTYIQSADGRRDGWKEPWKIRQNISCTYFTLAVFSSKTFFCYYYARVYGTVRHFYEKLVLDTKLHVCSFFSKQKCRRLRLAIALCCIYYFFKVLCGKKPDGELICLQRVTRMEKLFEAPFCVFFSLSSL